jgi:hypothetical protein
MLANTGYMFVIHLSEMFYATRTCWITEHQNSVTYVMPLSCVGQKTANTWFYACIFLYIYIYVYIFFISLYPTFLSVMWCVVGVQSNRHQCVKHWIKNSYMEKFLVIVHSDMSAICFTSDECSGSQKVIKWHLNVILFCFLMLWWWVTFQACENWCSGMLQICLVN